MHVVSAAIYRELVDNPGFGLGTRLKATTQRIHPGHPDLTRRFHSTPTLPCPGRAGSNSETQETFWLSISFSKLMYIKRIILVRICTGNNSYKEERIWIQLSQFEVYK